VTLDDASVVTGFLADAHGLDAARDITRFGGWRPYLASLRS
jgi:allophanate hydrolase